MRDGGEGGRLASWHLLFYWNGLDSLQTNAAAALKGAQVSFIRLAARLNGQSLAGASAIGKAKMNFKRCSDWIHSHKDMLFDFVRIYLGVGLCFKGIFFLMHPEQLVIPVGGDMATMLAHWVPYVHIVGGAMMALGVLTRLGALMQVPVLASAVVFANVADLEDLRIRESFEFSMLVLFLLVLVVFKGAGQFALFKFKGVFPSRDHSFNTWVKAHPDAFMDLLRIYLGVGLFIKGLYILEHRDQFMALFDKSNTTMILVMLALHYVIPAHLVGGTSLALGLVTRVSALVQLPLLAGAVFYVYLPRYSMLEQRESLEFTALVLFLLVILTAHGAGRLSLDHALEKGQEAEPQPQPAH